MPGATCITARSASAAAPHGYTEHSPAPTLGLSQQRLPAAEALRFLPVSAGGGQGMPRTAPYSILLQPYFQAADVTLCKSQHLGRAREAGPGRSEPPPQSPRVWKDPPVPPEHEAGCRTALRFKTTRVEPAEPQSWFIGLFGCCVYFLTCNDSSSFTSSFGGNKSLAWMYSKLGGPSSPCIANKTHIETGPSQHVL